jgi:hypothetical protein
MSRNLAAVSRRSAGAAGGQMRHARGGTPKPPKCGLQESLAVFAQKIGGNTPQKPQEKRTLELFFRVGTPKLARKFGSHSQHCQNIATVPRFCACAASARYCDCIPFRPYSDEV